jgi:SAM-dependent methyltransferase
MSSTFNARSPAAYESFMGRWSRRICGPFIAFTGSEAGESIVDVGCGTGSLTRALADAVQPRRLVGVDLSDAYLEEARKSIRDPRVSFEKGDATQLKFPDATFDRAMSMLVLQFVPDTDRAIGEMKRVVRPGGMVAAAVWDSYGGMPAQRMFWDTASHIGVANQQDLAGFFFRPMTKPGELAAAWTRQGLINVEQSSLTIRMDYSDFDDYWAPIAAGEASLGKFASDLNPADRSRLETAVRTSFMGGYDLGLQGPRGLMSMPAPPKVNSAVLPL